MDLATLNPAQRAAVTAEDGAQLVVAGAGTGKTRTLVHRVAWLLEQGVPAREIVLLTFTRRAAGEMLDRVAQMVGSKAHGVRGGTFHGFGHTLLRKYAPRIGFSRGFTILDSSDTDSLVGLVRAELVPKSEGKRFPKSPTLRKMLSRQINTGRDLADIVDAEYDQYLDELDTIARIGERFAARKRASDVMDFDDLLVWTARLLAEHPDVRDRVAERCRYVLVDEYQDTNRLQAQIACLLSVRHGNLMVVGDEAQSIYGFRGADVDNILSFPDLFPGCKVLLLEQNYRSTQPVLDLANGILDSGTEGYDKRLFSSDAVGERPFVVPVADDMEQPAYIVGEILRLREEGVPLRGMAVLFRSSYHANLVEVELRKANLPFRKFGGVQFVEAAHVKDVCALLRMVANPRDELAWLRVLQWFEGVGAKTARDIARRAMDDGRLDPTLYAKRKYHGGLVTLSRVLHEAEDKVHDVEALVVHLIEYYRGKLPDLHEDFRKREPDLDTLLVLAGRAPDLQTYLAELTLDPPQSADLVPSDHEDEWLTLSTIHSAKGLEWHTVFVLQLADGHFPSHHSLDDPRRLEEERRLFYVACTRAERRLYLMRPELVPTRFGRARSTCTLLDTIPGVDDLLQIPDEGPVRPAPPRHPELAAAEERLKRFLDFYGR